MPRYLLGPSPRQERATQQRLTSRIANQQAKNVRRAIRRAMRNAAEVYPDEGRLAIGPAVEDQRQNMSRVIGGMYESAWQTIGGRVLRAAKSLHGREWELKQTAEEQQDEELRQFIAQWQARRVSLVLGTTEQQLASIIERGEREGLGVENIAKRIRSNADQMSRVRSQVIARTEVHNAGQAAMEAGARSGGVASQKEWFAALDDRTRDDRFSHVDADGETTGVDGVFTNTGEEMRYPGDPRGSSGNTVMCRCSQGFIVD